MIVIVCTLWEIVILFNSRPHSIQKKEYQGVATSKLLYVPDITDDGHYLTCRSPRIISSRLKQKMFSQTLSYHQHHRVLAEGAMEESLEDTWEIKVLCESKTSSIWISHFERKTCHRQASSLFASGSLAGSRQPSNRWKMMIMSGGDGELSSYCQGTMSTLNAKSERTRFPTSWSGCTM